MSRSNLPAPAGRSTQGLNMKSVTAGLALALALTMSAHSAPRKQTPKSIDPSDRSLANLKSWDPEAFKTWQDAVPAEFYTPATPWLTRFDGVTTPTRTVTLQNGDRRIMGWVCKPNYCVNDAAVMIAPGRVVGIAHFEGIEGQSAEVMIGTISADETVCLMKFRSSTSITSC